jgi:hypothetical protein
MAETWRIRIPLFENEPDGEAIWGTTDKFVGKPESDGVIYDGVVHTLEIHPDESDEDYFFEESWLGDLECPFVYVGIEEDPRHLKVYRRASPEEVKRLRAPQWISGDDTPECCGRPMFFVGQMKDENLHREAPDDCRLWWHDIAFFYVFTCSQCMSVKAVGQQF